MSKLKGSINLEAFSIVEEAVEKSKSSDLNVLCQRVCDVLESKYDDEIIDAKLEEIGMSTVKEIQTVINYYIKNKKLNNKSIDKKKVDNTFKINTNPTAFSIVSKAIRKMESFDPNVLCPCICEILENTYKDSEFDENLEKIRMSTTKDIHATINSYIQLRYKKEVNENTILSKEVKNIINKAISNVNTSKKNVILNEIIKVLHETFPEDKYEYKTIKLGLDSDDKILSMLSLYLYDYDDKNKNYRNVCSLLF